MYLGNNNTSSKVSKYMCVCVLINAKNPGRFLSKIGSIIFYIDLEVLIHRKIHITRYSFHHHEFLPLQIFCTSYELFEYLELCWFLRLQLFAILAKILKRF